MIIFLIKQDGAVEVGVSRKRSKGSGGGEGARKSQGIKPTHGRLEAARGRDDSVAIWCKTGVGQGQKGVGTERKKQTMLQTGRRAGAHRSAVCRLFVSSLANRGPSVDHLQRQCEDEDAPSGDMEMCTKLRNSACLHDADKMAARSRSQNAFQKRAAIC